MVLGKIRKKAIDIYSKKSQNWKKKKKSAENASKFHYTFSCFLQ